MEADGKGVGKERQEERGGGGGSVCICVLSQGMMGPPTGRSIGNDLLSGGFRPGQGARCSYWRCSC
jgi:hypothetical protein